MDILTNGLNTTVGFINDPIGTINGSSSGSVSSSSNNTTNISNFFNTYNTINNQITNNQFISNTISNTFINNFMNNIDLTPLNNKIDYQTTQINALNLQNEIISGSLNTFDNKLTSFQLSNSNAFTSLSDLIANQALNFNTKFDTTTYGINNRLSGIETNITGFSNDLSKFSTKLDEIPSLLKSLKHFKSSDA